MAPKVAPMVAPDDNDWLTLRGRFKNHSQIISESVFGKVLDKCSQYWVPAVAVGALTTTGALAVGMYKCVAGKERTCQLMMRTRVLAQGFTLAALIVGCLNSNYKNDPNVQEPPPRRTMAKSIPIPIK